MENSNDLSDENTSIEENDRQGSNCINKPEETRSRKPTERGLEFKKELAIKERQKALRTLRKQSQNAESAIADSIDVGYLLENRKILGYSIDTLTAAHDEVMTLLQACDAEKAAEQYEQSYAEARSLIKAINDRIIEIKTEKNEYRSSYSGRSRSTRVSSKHSTSSTRKANILANAAKLETELQFLNIESEKVAELKRVQLMKELATKRAQIEVFNEVNTFDLEGNVNVDLPNEEDDGNNRVESYLASLAALDPRNNEESQVPRGNVIQPWLPADTPKTLPDRMSQVPRGNVIQPRLPADTPETLTHQPLQAPRGDAMQSTEATSTGQQRILQTPRENTINRKVSAVPSLRHNGVTAPHTRRQLPVVPAASSSSRPSQFPRGECRATNQETVYHRCQQPFPLPCSSPITEYQASPDHLPSSTTHNMQTQQTVDETLTRLADILTQKTAPDRLPLPEPDIFRGDVLHFPKWLNAFESIIESQTTKPEQRLFYLSKYTTGEAKEAINGYLTQNNENSYGRAKEVLMRRYGNPYFVADAYRRRIRDWPKIAYNDGTGLRKFSDFLNQARSAMSTTSYLNVLNDPEENQRMAKKLPSNLINRWSRIVDRHITPDDEDDDVGPDELLRSYAECSSVYPPFSTFCRFVQTEARIACNPVSVSRVTDDTTTNRNRPSNVPRRQTAVGAYATGVTVTKSAEERTTTPKTKKQQSCVYCKEDHELDDCSKFLSLTVDDKRSYIIKKRLCWTCLKWGHISSKCRNKKTCRTCKETHPTALHDDNRSNNVNDKPVSETAPPAKESAGSHCIRLDEHDSTEPFAHSLIVPVWVYHKGQPDKKKLVYALLDEQSDACFVKDSLVADLQLKGTDVSLELSTVLGKKTIASQKVEGIVVCGYFEDQDIKLPRAYTRESIYADRDSIPRPETARKWPHLEHISESLMPISNNVDIEILIGNNCTRAIRPQEIIPGGDDDPYGKKTALGWGIVGVVNSNVNTIASDVECRGRSVFLTQTHVKEVYAKMKNMLDLDFSENEQVHALSHDDRLFLKKVEEGIHQLPDGHYEMPLPLKNDDLTLPNNRDQAMRRLTQLKQRFLRDSRFKEDYTKFMNELISRNYAEKVPSETHGSSGHTWYLPHHGVYHAKKPGKIRVVFDCSAEYKGESLNRHLLQGPDLINSLQGVLLRFRQESTAVMCDIEGMFLQVHVNPEHRNFLRFLWWDSGNLEDEPVEYRMTVHLFGATSSPGCANYALKTAAKEFKDDCGHHAADFVKNDFYVDDGLRSVPSAKEAIQLIKDTKDLCKKGGFRLHKFVSNNADVISAIPTEERASGVRDPASLPIERALGVQWCVESDTLRFRIDLPSGCATRRKVLSAVGSVFDPLGILAPVVLKGKAILQQLCRDGVGWDDDIPELLKPQWEKWRNDLKLLVDVKVPRCYKPNDFGAVKTVQIHNFSDASIVGYGQCSYLRLTNEQDRVHVTLVMAKSRVAPLKPMTVPRLELTAALVSTKVNSLLRKELNYDEIQQRFWTDSQVVLGYISNNARRFHTFVANRVQQIRDVSSPDEWRYVDTKLNPADLASRGLSAEELMNSKEWWNGPDFLWKPIDDTLGILPEVPLASDDPEIKARTMATATEESHTPDLEEQLKRFSDWTRAKRAVAVCLRLKDKIIKRREGSSPQKETRSTTYVPVNVSELQKAETVIVKAIQSINFKEEISILRSTATRERNRTVIKSSPLRKLDPFLDESGVLRVGGRIRQADSLENYEKHPVILPKKGHITELIVKHYHERVAHQGRGMTQNEIRSSGVWIIGSSSAVAQHITKCVICRKVRASTETQKMADLPSDRLEPNPPFTFSAVDYFGPWFIKEGRRELKRYGVLFTCMASRAVHLEVANTLDTSSFLNAYRRFIGRRGPVRQLRSDRGTNFVGCKNELKDALKEMDPEKIKQHLLKENCDYIEFKMNVPCASHMGGSWERQIRTVRSVMTSLLDAHALQLDDESLRTLMVEAEAIINGRPLTIDPAATLEPLTPNHILTLKSRVVLPPPGNFTRADLYSRRRWRRVQHLANDFWNRWKKEVLQSLQMRQKWTAPRRNLKEGDIVLLKEDDVPRNRWRLARVQETYPDKDGLVRKVKISVADKSTSQRHTVLERPIQKLVLLYSPDDDDRGIPAKEPSKNL